MSKWFHDFHLFVMGFIFEEDYRQLSSYNSNTTMFANPFIFLKASTANFSLFKIHYDIDN